MKAGATDLRSEFEKDYHRIIGSASFRRLQDKTQVFPLDQSDFIRTRLTHSLEVSSFAKSLGQNIAENIISQKKDEQFTSDMKEDICNILSCAGLIHDIGNPPFGHFGEVSIREWFQANLPEITFHGEKISEILPKEYLQDIYQFEGNAQALRLVSKLHYLVDEHGMNLTAPLLATIMKYPISSMEVDRRSEDIKLHKPGYYQADKAVFDMVQKATGTNGNRHPLTFILEASDDIAYKTADIEDGFVKGFFTYQEFIEELKELPYKEGMPFDAVAKLEEQYLIGKRRGDSKPDAYALKNWLVRMQSFAIRSATDGFISHYDEIMNGTYTKDLFAGTYAQELMYFLGDFANRKIFMSDTIYRLEMTESLILKYLLNRFVRAAVKYDDDREHMDSIDQRLVFMISENYKNAYAVHSAGKSMEEKLYLRILLVTDYICGMTDSYAKRLFQELNAMF